MDRRGEGDPAEVEAPGAAGVHGVDFLEPLAAEPLEQIVAPYQRGAAQAGDRLDIGDMVEVTVRDEDVVGA